MKQQAAAQRNPVAAAAAQQVAPASQGGAVAAYDYGEDANKGFASLGKESLSIPFLQILQGQSPELETVDGAKPGMLYNSVTGKLYDNKVGVVVVPCEGNRSFVEWRIREDGGGIVDRHAPDSELVKKVQAEQKLGKYKVPGPGGKQHELIETFYMYVNVVNEDGSFEPAVISFKSTGIKVFRNWRTKISLIQVQLPDGRRVNPPPFAHKFRVTTHKEKNAQGEWWAPEITYAERDAESSRLAPSDPLYQASRDFAASVNSGKATLGSETPPAPAEGGGQEPTNKF